MKIKAIFILLILTKFGFSQISPVSGNLLFGIKTGFNITRFNTDIKLNHGTKPLIGCFIETKVLDLVYLTGSVSYSIKGSKSVAPFYKIENHYIEPEVTLGINLVKGLRLNTGLKISLLKSANQLILSGSSFSGYERIPVEGYGSEVSLPIGISYYFHRNTSLTIDYNIPVVSYAKSNFGLTFKIPLNTRNTEETYRNKRKNASVKQIKQLQKGTLIVRLKTLEKKIQALKDIGEVEMAEKIYKVQQDENLKLVQAFRNEFDFCEVRFTFSNNSQNILDGSFDNIFLNDKLEADSSIRIDVADEFFIADFGTKSKDTVKYYSHTSYNYVENKGIIPVDSYYTNSIEFQSTYLVISDKNFIRLNKPFPYFVLADFKSIEEHPEHNILLTPFFPYPYWNFEKTVRNLNNRLHEYYNKVN